MGDRHNRKRVRHRPVRRQRLLCCQQTNDSNITTSPLPSSVAIPSYESSTNTCTCWRPTARPFLPFTNSLIKPSSTSNTISPPPSSSSTRTHRTSNLPNYMYPTNNQSSSTKPGRSILPETPRTRTRRVFGGVDSFSGDDDEDFAELCGPMLDVVLGLFGGVDYED